MADETPQSNSIALATSLTAAWLGNPHVRVSAADVPAFLCQIHDTLNQLAAPQVPAAPKAAPTATPAVSPRASIRPDYLVSLIDGKRYKTLRRHLAGHGLTPEQYRERYGLRPDYPMTAPNYSATRRELAQQQGLGRTLPTAAPSTPVPAASGATAPAAAPPQATLTAPAASKSAPPQATTVTAPAASESAQPQATATAPAAAKGTKAVVARSKSQPRQKAAAAPAATATPQRSRTTAEPIQADAAPEPAPTAQRQPRPKLSIRFAGS